MRISVLINNHNYGRYLSEAVVSASLQSLAPHEMIVIDDGSTDESATVLEKLHKEHPSLAYSLQNNLGQLAAFRAGAERAAGDWCALLDADDTWMPDHLETMRETMSQHPDVGIQFAAHRESSGPPLFRTSWPSVPIGPVAALVASSGLRFGSITSTICVRTDLLREITKTTLSLEDAWRIRADDVVIFGAALSGTKLFHGDKPTVNYRIHGQNAFAGNAKLAADTIFHQQLERVVELFRARYDLNGRNLTSRLIDEWRSQRAFAPRALRKRYRKNLRRAGLLARIASFF